MEETVKRLEDIADKFDNYFTQLVTAHHAALIKLGEVKGGMDETVTELKMRLAEMHGIDRAIEIIRKVEKELNSG